MAAFRNGETWRGEESPGSTETRCRLTAGGGNPRESATESKPPTGLRPAARVKGCGKSAPRLRQRRRHGKPHREQDQIGATCRTSLIWGRQAGFRAAARVGRARRPATGVPDEWPSSPDPLWGRGGQNPAYRPSGIFFPFFSTMGHSRRRFRRFSWAALNGPKTTLSRPQIRRNPSAE